ncbi:unnamed protein product, partial [Ectocarpus sp. 12 AP-2014]
MEHPDKLINNFKGKLLLQWRNKKRRGKTNSIPASNADRGKPAGYNTEQQQTADNDGGEGDNGDHGDHGAEAGVEQAVQAED